MGVGLYCGESEFVSTASVVLTMLNWFRSQPTLPVTAEEQAWIEDRFGWLTRELGLDRLRAAEVILPTVDYFPSRYEPTEEDIGGIVTLVAGYMQVDPARLRLSFYQDDHPKFEGMTNEGTAGLYVESEESFDIWLEVGGLEDPLGVVATVAHEIGHVILLGERRVAPEEEDHEPLTDLLTVFLGMGVLTANNVVQESSWSVGTTSGWSIGRRGYLSMNMFGYALALFALARNEPNPAWAKYLRPDVLGAFRQGVRYNRELMQ